MTSTFKVGDRVRLTGEEWKTKWIHGVEVEVFAVDDIARFRHGLNEWFIGRLAGKDFSATLVEPAHPPPDTRKRLREYTDLADGDVAVIAGVPLTIKNNGFHSELRTCALGYESIADFFVDEVRRKPRTKKRRVYEEVDAAEAKKGDFLIDEQSGFHVHYTGGRCPGVVTFYRLVEETEVPR